MRRRVSRSLTKLSFKQASSACRGLIPIGEALFDHVDSLENASYSAFLPHYTFEQSFCAGGDDFEIHKRCLIEQAKLTLGRPWPLSLRIRREDKQYLFTSPFIEELCKKRDIANGVPVGQLALSYPGEIWRTEIDPCRYRMQQARMKKRGDFEEQWRIVCEERKRRLDEEVTIHSAKFEHYESGLQARHMLFKEVMETNLTTLGFEYDEVKSWTFSNVFTKRVSEDFDLCFVIEDMGQFWFNQMEGNFNLNLEVRNRQLIGSIEDAEPGTYLIIRFQQIIPGFIGAYRKFFNLHQLEVIIKAHVFLYGLVRRVIEDALLEHL
jgi:hypothetical protein